MKKLLGILALAFLAGSTFFLITGSVGATKPIFGQGGDDLEVAKQISLGILRDRAAQRAIGNVDEFQIQKVEVDQLKMAHTRVRQTVAGVPVWEGEAIVHLKSDGALSTITDDMKESLYVDTNPTINEKQAVNLAVDAYRGRAKQSESPTIDLWVYRGETRDHLVYRVTTPRIDGLQPSIARETQSKALMRINVLKSYCGTLWQWIFQPSPPVQPHSPTSLQSVTFLAVSTPRLFT